MDLRSAAFRIAHGFLGLAAVLIPSVAVFAQESSAPIAATVLTKCRHCHGDALQYVPSSLATRESMLKGGDHGPAIVPGDAAKSLVFKRITGEIQPAMPMAPLPRLTSAEIAAIRDWINNGAVMAENKKPAPVVPSDDGSLLIYGSYRERPITDADREWWAFQKPVRADAPHVKDARWSKNPIDAFVKAKLEEKGLTPAPQADRNILIRRVYLDLVGLLPTPAEVDAFVKDPSPRAYRT